MSNIEIFEHARGPELVCVHSTCNNNYSQIYYICKCDVILMLLFLFFSVVYSNHVDINPRCIRKIYFTLISDV